MDIHFKKLLLPILALFAMTAHAQSLSGLVTDEETGQPLEAVMISVLRNGTMIDYALTDARGRYSLPWKYNGNLQVSVSLLGYRREIRNISAAGTLHIRLHPEAIALKEVQIRPGRIHGRKDTVRYNLAEFASSKDVHIKDVLKKLPGVDIDDNGQVKYKGKAIDHYFVEGMDVTGGRYSQINNNLSAKAVKSAEIMENYQSVKALKGKLSSDEIALNLKLDPQARNQWIVNGTLGTGWSDGTQETTGTAQTKRDKGTLLWENAANALQLGKGKQSIYGYKSNNNGTDLSREQHILTNNTSQQIPLHGFLVQPGISAPLDKQRLLFNETHTLNANRMYKWNDERSLRLQAGYTHNRITQQRGNSQVYYQPDDTIRMDEAYHYCLQNDAAHMEMHYEDNKTIHYLSNRFLAESETNRGTSHELQQTMRTSQFTAKNFFSLIRNGEKSTWKFNSATQYAYLPSSLSLHDGKDKFIQHSLYNDNKASHLRKHNGFTRQYTAGIKGEWASVKHHSTRMETFGASSFSPYLSPYFQLEQGKWQGSLSLPLSYKRYFSQQRSFLFFNPSLYLRYQPDYHWKISLYGSLHRSAGDVTDLCPFTYRTDYRTWKNTDGLFPVSTRQQYNLYGEYKNTVQEFFATATLSYRHVHYNTLNEQSISENRIVHTLRLHSNSTQSWFLLSTLSKGFFDWNLKTSLDLQLSRNTGWQLTRVSDTDALTPQTETAGNGPPQKYRYDYLKMEPTLIWSPAEAFEAEYHATINYGGSKIGNDTHLAPLLDFVQRMHLTFSIGHVDLCLSGEHYRNDLNSDTHLNTLFVDASLIYKTRKWRVEASLSNLFNKKEYAYTTYSATQSYTSRLNIRPREVMVTAGYQF